DECPYKGLAPFDEDDAAYFFGRERLVGELAARTVGVGLLGVIGASGSGKSSVVRAGLVPSLGADLLPGSARWRTIVMRPGDRPTEALRDALGGLTLDAAVRHANADQRLVLIVDQFEETFSLTQDENERTTYLDEIADVIGAPDRIVVILVMRDDFYGRCAPYEQIARPLSANHVLVAPMDRDELRRAIELPARRARLHVEAALADALIAETADEPGSLPLLSTALAELWAARSDGWMRMEAYEQTGGLRGAIARLAEESFGRLSPPEQQAARAMLLRLTGSGEGDTVTRRRASIDEFDLERHPETRAVLDRFTQDRLLTMSEGSVEVAHEALLREWPRLREWLAEDVQGRVLRQHLTEAAKQWDMSGHESGELYRGARLSSALDWTTLHGRELNELEQQFMTESRQASEQEIERQRRTNRRLRGLLSGVAVFLVLALMAGLLALVQRSTARKNATAETAQRLGAQALVQNDLDLSLLLAREGVNISDTTATRGYLLAALLRSPAALGVLRPLPGRELKVWVIDGGKRLLIFNNAAEAGVVDLATRKLVGTIPKLLAIGPSADGMHVNVVVGRGNALILDTSLHTVRDVGIAPAQAGQPAGANTAPSVMTPDGLSIGFVAPSGKGTYGVAVQKIGARAFDMYRTAPGVIGLIEFSADGKYLITGTTNGKDAPIQIWRVGDTTHALRTIHYSHGNGIATISPDDRMLAVGGLDGSVSLFDLATGTERLMNGRHDAAVDWVAFSPNGRTLVTTGDDSLVLVWDVRTGALLETLRGHNGRIPQVSFAPDGKTIYTASLDGSIMIWDISGSDRLGDVYRVDGGGVDFIQSMVAKSPDGRMLAFPSTTGDVVLRDASTLQVVRTIHTGGLPISVAFSPDSRDIAVNVHTFQGSDLNGPCLGYRAAVWDVATGSPVSSLIGPPIPKDLNDPRICGDFESLAWSPDGRTIVGAFDDSAPLRGTVWFWSFPGGGQAKRHFEVPADPNGGRNAADEVLYSPDGKHLAVAWGESATMYDATGSTPLFTVDVDQGYGRSKALAFSPDGSLLATGGGSGLVSFWDTATGRRAGRTVLANACWIDSLEFNAAGTQLLSSGCDGSARLIDMATRSTIGAPLQGPGNVHNSAVFSGDYRFVDVAYTDGTMLRWDIDPAAWRARACEVAGRNLTRDEWARFLPERPYGTVCPGL
ncbi:MAG TPA: hypothetical protein VJ818_01280, partial [Actinomycetota bacterium]|nr:hypothetical protein [Actinomycetota bacterium]